MPETDHQIPGKQGRRNKGVSTAHKRITRWPGWVWAIPLAALIFVTWLAAKTWLFAPPEITVHFPTAAGISIGTPVKDKGVQVGSVDDIRLDDSLKGVILKLAMKDWMAGHIGANSKFWIVRPELGKGAITNLISGAYVAMQPSEGNQERNFVGIETPPIRDPDEPGRRFILSTSNASGITKNAALRFHGLEVGRVLGLHFNKKNRRPEVIVFLKEKYASFVQSGTVFWKSGDFSVSWSGGGVGVAFPSLSALTSGAIDFDTPAALGGSPAAANSTFLLYASRDEALAHPTGLRFAYFVLIPGAARDLSRGAPVELDGRKIGRVTHVGLDVDAQNGKFATPVLLEIKAPALGIQIGPAETRDDIRKKLDRKIAALVAKGLRAHIGPSAILIGGQSIELTLVADAKKASLDRRHKPPALPAVAGSGALADVVGSIGDVAGKLNELPLKNIARNMERTTARIEDITNSPEIRHSLDDLDKALYNLRMISKSTKGKIGPLLQNLAESVDSVRSAAAAANRLAGGSKYQNRDLSSLVSELIDSARAVKVLADYLTRHPESLIQGRERQ